MSIRNSAAIILAIILASSQVLGDGITGSISPGIGGSIDKTFDGGISGSLNQSCGTNCLGINGFSNYTASSLSAWKTARNAAVAGSSNARVLLIGDSETAGYGANNNVSNITNGWPAQLAPLVGGGIGSISSTIGWLHNGEGLNSDSRVSFGGWTNETAGVIGAEQIYIAASPATAATFLPTNNVDTFVVYSYIESGFDTLDVAINGTPVGTVNQNGTPGNNVTNNAFTATLGSNTIGFTDGTNGSYVDVLGVYTYNSAVKEISLMNAGWNGASAATWVGASNQFGFTWSYGSVGFLNQLNPALIIIQLGANDCNGSISIPSFTSNMQTLITIAKSSNASVMIASDVPVESKDCSSYGTAMQSLAVVNNIPFMDFFQNFGSWANANTNGWMFDGLHPNSTGYGVMAGIYAQILDDGLPVTPRGYFFAAAGSDSNSCTQVSPCQTVAHANGLSLISGDSLKFNGGDSFSGAITLQQSGVTVSSYGTGVAMIDSGSSSGFTALNKSSFTLSNLTFVGGGITTANVDGVHVENSQAGNTKLPGVTLSNLDISGYGQNGLVVLGSNGTSGFSGMTISDVNAHGNTGIMASGEGNAGIFVVSYAGYGLSPKAHSGITITGSTASGNTGASGDTNWNGSGIVVGECQSCTLTLSKATNNGADSNFTGGGPVGMWAFDSDSMNVSFNESYANKTASDDGGGFDFDGGMTNSVMEYNYSHDNDGAGFIAYSYNDGSIGIWNDNTFRYNISQNNSVSSTSAKAEFFVRADNTLTGLLAYGNTVYTTANDVVHTETAGPAGTFANNIFYAAGNLNLINTDGSTPSLTFIGNDYYTTGSFQINWGGIAYTSYALWQTATGQEKISGVNVGLTSNPMLSSAGGGGTCGGYAPPCPTNYELSSGSAMLGVGLTPVQVGVASFGAADFYGNVVPNALSGTGYNVGAWNAAGVGTCTSIMPASCLAWWGFGGSNANDQSGNGNNGTVVGTVSFSTGVATFGGGSTDYINIGTPSDLTGLQVPMTITAWVTPANNSYVYEIYSEYSGNTTSRLISVLRLSFGAVQYFGSTAAGTTQQANSSLSVTAGVQSFVAVTVSGSIASPVVQFYLNGTPDSSGPYSFAAMSPTPDTTVPIFIGNDDTAGLPGFPGAMSDVRVYGSALSSGQISAMNSAGPKH
jgi:lysophospholipase L1-like esterase